MYNLLLIFDFLTNILLRIADFHFKEKKIMGFSNRNSANRLFGNLLYQD